MGKNVQSMMFLSVALILLISACWMSWSMTREMELALEAVKNSTKGQARSVHTTLGASGAELFTGAQVLYSARERSLSGLVIEVDGYVLSGSEMTDRDHASIDLASDYFVHYARSGTGSIEKLVFTKAPKGTRR